MEINSKATIRNSDTIILKSDHQELILLKFRGKIGQACIRYRTNLRCESSLVFAYSDFRIRHGFVTCYKILISLIFIRLN